MIAPETRRKTTYSFRRPTMRKLLFAATLIAGVPLVAACTKTVEQEARDVRRTEEQAARNIAEEQKDVAEAEQQAAENIAEEKRDVVEQSRREAEKIDEEKRELEQARRRENPNR
jgi:predicted RNase H-like nuclease (RuvC/YqgF family)